MTNSVIVAYPSDSANQITVLYSIEQAGNMHTINCWVEGTSFPVWLQLRKFSIFSIEEYGNFTTLFNEINNSKNIDTALFIDLVYSNIMLLKHCKHS